MAKFVTHIVDSVCIDTSTGKVFHRNINQMDVPKGKGEKYLAGSIRRIVDERRSQGKPGPLTVKVYAGTADGIAFDEGGRVVGTKLIDEADKLTKDDYLAIEDAAANEMTALRVMKRSGLI